ncbi:MAG TPA: type II secretion system minor pseudopilin GspJ [Candidatus Kapabacteria bacterium]|nr:type II secretion system minor pseudopilin GspJ [Candidatus Kapabacteria bacterium]
MWTSARRERQSGITLIELMIAMAIFAVMAASMFIAFNSIQQSKAGGDAASERLRQYQFMFNRMGQDFQQITPRPIRDEYGDPKGALIAGPEGGIEFTRTGWTRSRFSRSQRSNLQRIQYYLEDGQLVRAYWYHLDREPAAQPTRSVLLEGVTELKFKFYYSYTSDAMEPEPVEEWPPAAVLAGGGGGATAGAAPASPIIPQVEHMMLPRVIEVILTTEDLGEITRLFLVADRWSTLPL